jgi:DNA-binding NarL/FixJ family response regulator
MKTFLVEDNPTIRDNLISTLEELAPVVSVGCADTAEDGAAWLASGKCRWDLAIVDLFLKSGTGLRVLQACQGRPSRQKMVVFSNYATREMRLRCAELGADAIFDKSTEIDALLNYCQRQSENLARQTARAN